MLKYSQDSKLSYMYFTTIKRKIKNFELVGDFQHFLKCLDITLLSSTS